MANLLKNRPSQKEGGRSREGGEERAFAEQDLRNLRPAICVAEEVGAGLGIGEILQRSVPEIGWKFAWIKVRDKRTGQLFHHRKSPFLAIMVQSGFRVVVQPHRLPQFRARD
jgi:hypothetical protein